MLICRSKHLFFSPFFQLTNYSGNGLFSPSTSPTTSQSVPGSGVAPGKARPVEGGLSEGVRSEGKVGEPIEREDAELSVVVWVVVVVVMVVEAVAVCQDL